MVEEEEIPDLIFDETLKLEINVLSSVKDGGYHFAKSV